MTCLHLADDLSLPVDAVTETFGVLAIKGAGKTYTAKVLTEELTNAGQQVVVIDPLGVWWGLRSSADGSAPGLPFVILGGDHADAPLESTAGEVIADFVIDEHAPTILDLSHFRKAEMRRFATAFLSRLYHRNRAPLHLVVDEADLFAPQRPQKDETTLLGAMEDIVRRGRAKGIGCTLVTQRPAVIHKDVLTQISTLVALRLSGPQDRNAINDWVRANGTDEQRDQMMTSLASLPTGTAWFWSPHWLGIFQRVQIRRLQTFDSSATPKAGVSVVQPKTFAEIDLVALQQRMAETIERAQADDPKLLRQRIAELERQLKTQMPERIVEQVEVPVFSESEQRMLEEFCHRQETVDAWLREVKRELGVLCQAVPQVQAASAPVVEPGPVVPVRTARAVVVKPATVRTAAEVTAPQQRILDALASFERVGVGQPPKANVAVWADQSSRSSGYTNNLGRLRALGLINYPSSGQVALTDRGRAIASPTQPITSVRDLHQAWFAKLPNPQVRILQALIECYPFEVDRPALAHSAGQSASSSGYTNNLGALRSLGLLDYPVPGMVVATGLLFPEGIR